VTTDFIIIAIIALSAADAMGRRIEKSTRAGRVRAA
jgi:hypothetical protein